jgi:hypothetical protein
MVRIFTRLAVALALITAVAFAAPSATAQETPAARIHLLHGIPGVAVDVVAGGETVFEGFEFGGTQDLSALAGQTLTDLQVLVAGTDDVAIDGGDVQLPASGNHTVIAHLDAEGMPTLGVFENDTSPTAAGQGRLTVRHTAAAPAVDILANGAAAFTNVANGAEGSTELPAGTISASVAPTGTTDPVIGPADLTIEDGTALIVYAVGSAEDSSLDVLTETISGLQTPPNAVNTGTSPVRDGGTSALPWAAAALVVLLGGGFALAPRLSRTNAK